MLTNPCLFVIFDAAIPMRIELSFREKENKGELVTITSDFIPAYTLVVLAEEQLISQKIRALLARKKPRDFYDLYFILRKQLPIAQKEKMIPQVLKALKESEINFASELRQFLPKSHWVIIRDFKSTLVRELNRFSYA